MHKLNTCRASPGHGVLAPPAALYAAPAFLGAAEAHSACGARASTGQAPRGQVWLERAERARRLQGEPPAAAGGDGGLGGIGSAQGAQRPSTGRAPRKFGGKAEAGRPPRLRRRDRFARYDGSGSDFLSGTISEGDSSSRLASLNAR